MKIYMESYGCTLNKSETGLYVNRLLSEGNEITQSPDNADLRIIGTCVVIQHTEEKMLRRISDLSSHGKVQVMGCLPPISAGTIASDRIIPMQKRESLEFYTGALDSIDIRDPSIFSGIPINQGCTGSCNFCISHIARGKLVSRPVEKIVGQVELQLARGIREVRLSSLDSAAYGKDLSYRLNHLVNSVTGIKDRFMLRIGMMEPRNTHEILQPLLASYSSEKVFKFLHLPVQSGDDRILSMMNREYTVETFMDIVSAYRESYGDSTLSTDIITGYYGDDEASYDATVRMIERTRPEIINITRFSPRPFTHDYDKKIPPSNKIKKWSRDLTELHHSITREAMEKHVGTFRRIMITEHGKNSTSVGRDSAYRPVIIDGLMPLYSELECEIVDSSDTYLIGKPDRFSQQQQSRP